MLEINSEPKRQPEIVLLGEDSVRRLSGVLDTIPYKGDVEIEQARELELETGQQVVGPNLALLSQFLLGYRVSFMGSLIGFAYGFAFGTLTGSAIGFVYNKLSNFRNRGAPNVAQGEAPACAEPQRPEDEGR